MENFSFPEAGIRRLVSRIWKVDSGNVVKVFEASGGFYSVRWSPDGKYIVGAGIHSFGEKDRNIYVWDVVTGNERKEFTDKETVSAWGLSFSLDGRYLAVGSADSSGLISIWDFPSGEVIRKLKDPSEGEQRALDFSPDGKYLVSGGGPILLWDLESRKIVRQFGICHIDEVSK